MQVRDRPCIRSCIRPGGVWDWYYASHFWIRFNSEKRSPFDPFSTWQLGSKAIFSLYGTRSIANENVKRHVIQRKWSFPDLELVIFWLKLANRSSHDEQFLSMWHYNYVASTKRTSSEMFIRVSLSLFNVKLSTQGRLFMLSAAISVFPPELSALPMLHSTHRRSLDSEDQVYSHDPLPLHHISRVPIHVETGGRHQQRTSIETSLDPQLSLEPRIFEPRREFLVLLPRT